MNRFIKKVLVGFSCAAITITSFSSVFAMPTLLHEDTTIKHLSSGVTHEHIKQFHAAGWWNINVLRVDLEDEYTTVDTIFNKKGIAGTETITNMIKDTDAVGAINADFFSMGSPSFPLGAAISNGQIVSSPKYNDGSNLPVFSIDKNKNPFMSYWNWNTDVVAPNGRKLPVITINKDSGSHNHAVVFNDNWGGLTHNGATADVVDLVVRDNKVVDIRVGIGGIYVPEGATVINGRGPAKAFLLNNFKLGDTLLLKSGGNVDFNNISTAVGGGSWLLKDGAKTGSDINIKGNQPRTAIGLTADKKQLIMMTLDGRNNIFTGVTQPVLAGIMKHLGASDAINLDGGGSTTMATKERDEEEAKVVNILSQKYERKVSNGLGVFDLAPIGELHRLELSTDNKNTFNNASRAINVVGYDKYHHKLDVNLDDVEFTVEGTEGEFNKNNFKPSTTGKAKVKANLNGALGEIDINVLENPRELKFNTDQIALGLSANHTIGEVYGIDRRGIKAKVNPADITWETIGDIGSIENGVFTATDKPASGALVANFNGTVKTILVSVGLDNKPIHNLDSTDGITTSVYPRNLVGGSVALDDESKVGTNSLRLRYDFTKTDKTRAFYLKLGTGMKLDAKPSAIGLWINGNNDKTWVRGDIVDANGVEHKVDFAKFVDWTGWKNVEAGIPEGVAYPITLKSIYIAQIDPNNRATGQVKIDGISALYAKDIDIDQSQLPSSSVFTDEDNVLSKVEEGGFKFTVSSLANNQWFKDKLSENKYAFLFGSLHPDMANGLDVNVGDLNNGFSANNLGSTKFVKVNNANGGIRNSHADQWLWMKSAIENSNEKNIVLMLPHSIYSFTDKMEEEIFHKLINEYNDMGKNMYVVYGSNKTEMTMKDGIKYFEINTKAGANRFEFVVNGDKLTYQMFR